MGFVRYVGFGPLSIFIYLASTCTWLQTFDHYFLYQLIKKMDIKLYETNFYYTKIQDDFDVKYLNNFINYILEDEKSK